MHRHLTADFIFDGFKMHTNSVLTISSDGEIISLLPKANVSETPEYVKGILSPGFINAHCHLELSHLKGKISN